MTELIRRETVAPASSRADPKIVPGSDEAHDEATRAEDIAGNHAALRGLGIRPKLMVGGVNDPEEREADALADRVMRMPEEEVVRRRVAMTGGGAGGGDGVIRRKAASVGASGGAAPESVRDVLAQPGRPLDAETRAFFEPRFGVDLGRVRVHEGLRAGASARGIGAEAYAVGDQIVMGQGGEHAASHRHRSLMAHELAHAVLPRAAGQGVARRKVPTAKDWSARTKSFSKASPALHNKVTLALKDWHDKNDDKELSTRRGALRALEEHLNAVFSATMAPGNAYKALRGAVALEHQKLDIIERIKARFGVTLRQSEGIAAVATKYRAAPASVRNRLAARDWTLHELRLVEQALARFKPFGADTRDALRGWSGPAPLATMSRLKLGIDVNDVSGKLDPGLFGETLTGSSNVSIFDVAWKNKDFATNKSKLKALDKERGFRGVVLHELVHALVEDLRHPISGHTTLRHFLLSFGTSSFWGASGTSVYKKYKGGKLDEAATRSAASAAGVEAPMTVYAMKSAAEDLAEAMMFYFEAPGRLESRCPRRYAFIENLIGAFNKARAAHGLDPQQSSSPLLDI